MKLPEFFVRTVTAAACCLATNLAWGQWQLDGSRSSLAFVTTKNAAVAEINEFGSLTGQIAEDGSAELRIHLDSVNTRIEIRDQRVKETLFETTRFPLATVTATVDPALLATQTAARAEITVTLSLHGVERELAVPVMVMPEGDGRLRVASALPVIVNAADFDLTGGIAALQKIAGLLSISSAIPVTFNLAFVAGDG